MSRYPGLNFSDCPFNSFLSIHVYRYWINENFNPFKNMLAVHPPVCLFFPFKGAVTQKKFGDA
jgi:hypothetical protein